jgi:hypothetical protein
MQKYYDDHSMNSRIEYLWEHSTEMEPSHLLLELKQRDADQGRRMQYAKSILSTQGNRMRGHNNFEMRT